MLPKRERVPPLRDVDDGVGQWRSTRVGDGHGDSGTAVGIASGARNDDLGHRSDLAHPAVDDELGAGDEARLVRRQEEHCRGDLLGTADAPDRDLLGDASDGVPVAVEEVGETLGIGGAGADRVGADVPVAQFGGERAGERAQRRLGGVVRARGRDCRCGRRSTP